MAFYVVWLCWWFFLVYGDCQQVFGLLTKPLINCLLPQLKHTTSMLSDPATPKSFSVPLLGSAQESELDLDSLHVPRPSSIRALLATPTHTVHRYWRKFDDAVMRPMFGGRGFVPFVPGSPTERGGHWEQNPLRILPKQCKICKSRWINYFTVSSCRAADKGGRCEYHMFAGNGHGAEQSGCVDSLLPSVCCPLIFGTNHSGLFFVFGCEFFLFFW